MGFGKAAMITTSMLAPYTRPGSLRLVSKHPLHVHGDSDDGTATRAVKARLMAGGINLPLSQPRRRPMDGTGIVIGCALGALISGIFALVALAAWRWFGA
jgi:hypothetical protein